MSTLAEGSGRAGESGRAGDSGSASASGRAGESGRARDYGEGGASGEAGWAHSELGDCLGAIANDDRELAALVSLSGLPNLGPATFRRLVVRGLPSELWADIAAGRGERILECDGRLRGSVAKNLAIWTSLACSIQAESELERHRVAEIGLLVYGAAEYPRQLLADPDPPVLLYRMGPAEVDARAAVAVVGTRKCSRYGRDVAVELGERLGSAGFTVVSGLARGIDACAHRGALESNLSSALAVVAGGLDVVYPRSNQQLWEQVAASGAILSEVPLGGVPLRWRFPARNRLIAALASTVVVVESASSGGSMYTVDEGLRRDKAIFAVPGSIRSPTSAGTNMLISDGAQMLISIEEFVTSEVSRHLTDQSRHLTDQFGSERRKRSALVEAPRSGEHGPAKIALPDEADCWLLACIGNEPTSLNTIVRDSGRDPSRVVLEVERQIAAGSIVRFGSMIERQYRL